MYYGGELFIEKDSELNKKQVRKIILELDRKKWVTLQAEYFGFCFKLFNKEGNNTIFDLVLGHSVVFSAISTFL